MVDEGAAGGRKFQDIKIPQTFMQTKSLMTGRLGRFKSQTTFTPAEYCDTQQMLNSGTPNLTVLIIKTNAYVFISPESSTEHPVRFTELNLRAATLRPAAFLCKAALLCALKVLLTLCFLFSIVNVYPSLFL